MRLKIVLIFFSAFIIQNHIQAQKSTDNELFTVNGTSIMVSDFLRVYNKNLDLVKDESQKDIDAYLDLYINYVVKLKEAHALGYHDKPEYKREFSTYKKQLARNYLTDKKVTEALVQEAYERISYDVNASHILVRLPETETDTAMVYNQLLAFRERFLNEPFEDIRKDAHNGSTVFVEDLGYFSGFKMVYDFENVAYNTPLGEVSRPFRTQFGYHVLKVNDKRKSRGEVTVGHIFLSKEDQDSLGNPEQRIKKIYKMLQQGNTFEDLAKQFSEDKSSSNQGGKLSPIKSGQLRSVEFENRAFSIEEIGEITEPFETEFGWHIAKLYKKAPIAPYEELRSQLETRVKRDSRSAVINESFINSLKTRYGVDEDIELSYFESILNDAYFKREWTVPSDISKDRLLLKINDTALTYFDFASYLEKTQKRIVQKQSYEGVVKSQFDAFLNEKLLAYHEDNLADVNEEYARVLDEYRDGLLLFDLMEDKIWNAVKEDTLGLQAYFNKNKSKYMWPDRYKLILASAPEMESLKACRAAMRSGDNLDQLKSGFGSKTNDIIISSRMFDRGTEKLPPNFDYSPGTSEIFEHNGAFHVVRIEEFLKAGAKTFDEAKGSVISDYQQFKEEEWIRELREKYPVTINKRSLEKIKSELAGQ
ncbi:MAG: peptidylprolyl isomerase [Flavobacteriaceae bacterium]|nr:peptidylprolyl isomerase [Flavobacteriaceae bacterium]